MLFIRTLTQRGGCALIGGITALLLLFVCQCSADPREAEEGNETCIAEGALQFGVNGSLSAAAICSASQERGGETKPDWVAILLQLYSRQQQQPLNSSHLLPTTPRCLQQPDTPQAGGHAPQLPRCEEGKGCDTPLHCYDFRQEGAETIVPHPPRAVDLSPHELERILENQTIVNCCAIVMFYAPWCDFSVRFAQQFNALGRTFEGLPVFAVDFSIHEPLVFCQA